MTYRIEGEWLVDDVNECTCGGSGILSPSHQPGCGSDPIAKIEDILRDSSLLSQVKQALLEGGHATSEDELRERVNIEHEQLQQCMEHEVKALRERDEARAQLAAAEARIEAVKARAAFESAALNVAYRRGFNNAMGQIRAALSVAPQPQPARGLHADGVDPTECEHGETKPHDFWPHDKPPRGRIVKPEWCPGPVASQPQPEAFPCCDHCSCGQGQLTRAIHRAPCHQCEAPQPQPATTEARLEAARAWLARIEPYPERNGDHFRELREILGQ